MEKPTDCWDFVLVFGVSVQKPGLYKTPYHSEELIVNAERKGKAQEKSRRSLPVLLARGRRPKKRTKKHNSGGVARGKEPKVGGPKKETEGFICGGEKKRTKLQKRRKRLHSQSDKK